jgi:xylulokinase
MIALSLPFLFWLRHRDTELFNRAAYFATTIDYINYRLTGRFVIDYSSLAMTEFLDISERDWSDRLLGIAGVGRDKMAQIVPSGEVVGTLTGDASEELGLPRKVLVISGAHDQYCANVGAGAVRNGDCVLSSGTAWVLLATSDRLLRDGEGLIHPCMHLLRDKYGLMTTVPSAGDSLNWFHTNFERRLTLEQLGEEAGQVSAGAGGLIFVPKFISASKRASFIDVDTAHSRMHFARAVFEGVALANQRHMKCFESIGLKILKILMIGGGARSSLWPQIVADVSGIPVVVPEQKESACAGAALLAGAGSGVFRTIEEAAGKFTGEAGTVEPNAENAEVYRDAFHRFSAVLGYV